MSLCIVHLGRQLTFENFCRRGRWGWRGRCSFSTPGTEKEGRGRALLYVHISCCSVLQCVAVCCMCVACVLHVCCGVLHCVAVRCSVLQCGAIGLRNKEEVVCSCMCTYLVAVYCSECVAVSVLQCDAVCCSVLQCVAVCCSVLQYVAVGPRQKIEVECSRMCIHVSTACCRLLVCCSVLQCVAVCCSVLQSAAVCCSVLQWA